jgi:hypothetical protein
MFKTIQVVISTAQSLAKTFQHYLALISKPSVFEAVIGMYKHQKLLIYQKFP